MGMVVCEVCGKNCHELTSAKIKDGYMCGDCGAKFNAMIGKHEEIQLSSEDYKKIMAHPANAQKIKKKVKKSAPTCCVCETDDLYQGHLTSDQQFMCNECVTNCITVSDEYMRDFETFFSTHEAEYFKEELAECFNPRRDIVFNFKTEKIYLKNTLSKKKYKVVSFSDVLNYKMQVYDNTSSGRVRHLDINIRYNGTTIRYHIDDSIDKHFEFDKVLDCIHRIPHLNQENSNEFIDNNGMNTVGDGEKQNDINGIICPRCGSMGCSPIVETNTSGKDFSAGKGCCGFALLGPLGILCGACGKGKQTNSTMYWVCSNCGNKFQK